MGSSSAVRAPRTLSFPLLMNRSRRGDLQAIEFTGETVEGLDMAGRMTCCNMAIEMGVRPALFLPIQLRGSISGTPEYHSVSPEKR